MKKRLVIIACSLCVAVVVLLILGYVVISRPAFVRGQVLSRVSEAIGMPVTAGRIQFRPFSSIELTRFAVGDGDQPLFEAGHIQCRYRLGELLKHRLVIEAVEIEKPVVRLVRDASGKLNLPSPKTGGATAPAAAPTPNTDTARKGGLPLVIEIGGFHLSNGAIQYTDEAGHGAKDRTSVALSGVDVDVPAFVLGKKSRLALKCTAEVSARRGAHFALRTGRLAVRLETDLRSDLLPGRAECDMSLSQLTGTAGTVDLEGRKIELALRSAAAPAGTGAIRIEKLVLRESHRSVNEAELTVAGDVDPAAATGRLSVVLSPVPPQVLNLLGRLVGDYDLGQTCIAYRGDVALDAGPRISAAGTFTAQHATLASARLGIPPTPPLDVRIEHDGKVAMDRGEANVSKFVVTADTRGQPLLRASLTAPAEFRWKPTPTTGGKETAPVRLKIALTQLPLAAFAGPFLKKNGVTLAAGTLDVAAAAEVRDQGKDLQISGQTVLANLAVRTPQLSFRQLTVRQTLDAGLKAFETVRLKTARTEVLVAGRPALDLRTGGTFNLKSGTGAVDVAVDDLNRRCLDLVPPNLLGGVRVNRFSLKGKTKVAVAGRGRKLGVDATFRVPEVAADLPGGKRLPPVSLTMALQGTLEGKRPIALDRFDVQLARQGKTLAQLGVRGTLVLPPDSTASEIEVTSDGIDAGVLAGLLETVPGTDASDEVSPPAKAPAPPAPRSAETPEAGLGKLAANVGLDLKNIRYGDVLVESCRGHVALKNSVVTAAPLNLVINGAPVRWSARVDLAAPGGLTYKTAGHIEKLPLAPFAATFAPDLGADLRGTLDQFDLEFAGKGTALPAILNSFTANLGVNLDSVAIPADPKRLAQRPGLRLLLLPFQVLGQATSLVPGNRLPGTVRNLSAKSRSLLSKAGEVSFDQVHVELKGQGGRIEIPKCELRNSIVPDLIFRGALLFPKLPETARAADIDPRLDLAFGFRVGRVALTIPVGGTLRHPLADTRALTRGLIKGVGNALLNTAAESLKQGKKLHGGDLLRQVLGGKPGPEPAQTESAEGKKELEQKPQKREDLLLKVLGGVLGGQKPAEESTPKPVAKPEDKGEADEKKAEPAKAKPAPTKKEQRKARRKALEQLGGKLFQNLLAPKREKQE